MHQSDKIYLVLLNLLVIFQQKISIGTKALPQSSFNDKKGQKIKETLDHKHVNENVIKSPQCSTK